MTDETLENDGLEEEVAPDESSLPDRIEVPFDPAQIKISRKVVPVNLIVQRIGFEEIDLSPEFQRRARIWDITRKSRLIESILLRIPLPVFYVAADVEDNWRVVDGLQRLTTISDFVATTSPYNFHLRGLEYLTSYEGAGYLDLPRSIKRRIDETELNVNVIESGTPETVMFNIFRRLNTGGISLNSQEIRNALHPGPVRQFLIDLAVNEEFLQATDHGVRDDRMGARELALRFCAFRITSFTEYGAADLDGFLSEAMRQINEMSQRRRADLRGVFQIAMERSYQIFGRDAFRKQDRFSIRRSPVNRALFEVVAINLASLDDDEFSHIAEQSDHFRSAFVALFDDNNFVRSISLSTGSRQSVMYRFRSVQRLVRDFL